MREKVFSGIWETCRKILEGYEYQNPPQMGANIYIYIYIYNCMYHIIIVIISKKNIVNQKILSNKMFLEFNFTYAVQISLRLMNPLLYYIYIYMKTEIVIISKTKSKIKKFSWTKCAWNSMLHMLYKFYQDRWTNTWRHVMRWRHYRKFHRKRSSLLKKWTIK